MPVRRTSHAPSRVRALRAAVAVGGAGLLAVLTLAPSSAAPPGMADRRDAWPVADRQLLSADAVRLVTGELLRVGEQVGGMPAVSFVDPGSARTFVRWGTPDGAFTVVPDVALPYVGAELDAALFDVAGLLASGHGTTAGDAVPVVVDFVGEPVGVPGVAVTGSLPGGSATGEVDADGAAALGQALASLDGETFLPGVARITLADAAAPAEEPAGPLSTLSVDVLPPDGGEDLRGAVGVMGIDTGAFDVYQLAPGALTLDVEVPDGRYAIFFYGDRSPAAEELWIYGVGAPEITVDGPTELVLDTADTVEATYAIHDGATPSDDAVELGSVRLSDSLSAGMSWGALFFKDVRAFLAPTDPVTVGTFDQGILWAGVADETFYTLPVIEHGQVPDDLAYELGPDDLAEIVSHYSRDVDGEYQVGRVAVTSIGGGTAITPNPAPGERVDVVTVDEVVTAGTLLLDPGGWIAMDRVAVAPAGGTSVDEEWLHRPIRPAVPDGLKGGAPNRVGDELNVMVMSFVDPGFAFGRGDPGAEGPSIDTITSELLADGEQVWTGQELDGVPIPVGADPATYELVLETARDADWWLTSTETRTVWTFDSERGGDDPVPLDLLQVDHRVALDPYNHTDAPFMIAFRPYNLAVPDGSTITDLDAEFSLDDGETWDDVDELVEGDDGWWTGGIGGQVCAPSCTLPVTLRVVATDESGASVEQTISRALDATFVESTATPTTTSATPTSTPPTSEPPTSEPPTTEPTTPDPTGTTTLPGTGGGSTVTVAVIGGAALLLGIGAVFLARRRLRG